MRSVLLALAVCALLAAADRALAYEAIFGMKAGVGYESNITRARDPLPDAVYLIEPRLKLRHDTERLEALIDYRPEAEIFHKNGGANGVNQLLHFRSNYQLSPRSQLEAENRFGYVRYLQQFDGPNEPADVEVGLARTTINRARLGYRYQLTPRLDFSLSAQHQYRTSTRETDPPVTSMIGAVDASYLLTRKDNVGAGLSYTYTSIADQDSRGINLDARRSNSVNLFLTWSRQWNREWQTLVRLGPAWVQSTRRLVLNGFSPITGQPVSVDQSLDSENVTAFGHIQLTRLWSKARLELNYQRSLSAVSNVGSDGTVDAAFANLRWDPSPRWRLLARGGWNRRVSLAADQSDSAAASLANEISQYYFRGELLRKLSQKVGLGVEFRYQKQVSEGFRFRNGFENYQVNLTARYEFAPLRP